MTAYISSAISSQESAKENLARSFGWSAADPLFDLRFHGRDLIATGALDLAAWRLLRGLEMGKVNSGEGGGVLLGPMVRLESGG